MDGRQDKQPKRDSRRMQPASLMGASIHEAATGEKVYIVERSGKFMARGGLNGEMYGKTLGKDVKQAEAELRRLLGDLERGAFQRPSDRRKSALNRRAIPRLTLRELFDEFLQEKRRTLGKHTANDYRNRLNHVLDFAEQLEITRRWSAAADVDREFVIELKAFLNQRTVARNGRPGGEPKAMSTAYIRLCLETLRTALAWAARADVRRLPVEFFNPVTNELVGRPHAKDPLRPVAIPFDNRIAIVRTMDSFQLLNLSILFVLPLRFEDVAGALISDLNFERRILKLGERFGGNDFTKGRTSVQMPLPDTLIKILQKCAADRTDGPLFRRRGVQAGRAKPKMTVAAGDTIEVLFDRQLRAAAAGDVQCGQDRKRVLRTLLQELGGISHGRVGKEVKRLLTQAGLPDVRPYDIRHAVTQELMKAGIRHLEHLYLTEHTTKGRHQPVCAA